MVGLLRTGSLTVWTGPRLGLGPSSWLVGLTFAVFAVEGFVVMDVLTAGSVAPWIFAFAVTSLLA